MLTLNGLLGVHVALQTDNQFRVTPPLPNGSSNPCDPKKGFSGFRKWTYDGDVTLSSVLRIWFCHLVSAD